MDLSKLIDTLIFARNLFGSIKIEEIIISTEHYTREQTIEFAEALKQNGFKDGFIKRRQLSKSFSPDYGHFEVINNNLHIKSNDC